MDTENNINSSPADNQENITDTETEQKGSTVDNKEQEEANRTVTNEIEGHYKDQNFYDEILEKLDIKKRAVASENKENCDISSKKEMGEKNISQAENQIKQIIAQDFDKIKKLISNGLITSAQGQNLKKQVLKKAFDKIVQTEKIKRTLVTENKAQGDKTQSQSRNYLDEFSKENPNFFTSDGRKEVLNYLRSANTDLGKDEISKISEIVRIIEKSAIDRYLQKAAHEKHLMNSNENAKQKLTANAQKSSFGSNLTRTFTREQIGKMSGKEFAKYEKAIMEQLKKGLIK